MSEAKNVVSVSPLEMGLHRSPTSRLRSALQDIIDKTSSKDFDAIVLAYGLCGRGVVGLKARSLPVVIPRAHDCIGIFFGNENYLSMLKSQPGTYFQSPGWLENMPFDGTMLDMPELPQKREELVKRYGEDNADYLLEQFARFTRDYQRLAFISTPVDRAQEWEHQAMELARQQKWNFEKFFSNVDWLRRLLNGNWDERDFLTVRPGRSVGLCHDGRLIGES